MQQTITAFESCNVNTSITERAGSFSLVLPFLSDTDISNYQVGSDVEITQYGHVFRGWVIKPPKKNFGVVKTVFLEGADYTAKTQKVVVTESYTNTAISTVVDDLFTKYVPWATRNNISPNNRLITIRFPDVYLWDAMEQICGLCDFDWYIDNDLDVNFFQTANSVNENVISEALSNYKGGTAQFAHDSSKLVNRLWVKGSKASSLPFTQNITVSTVPIPLYYKPRANDTGIVVTVGGVQKTLGIQNIHEAGIYDFLLNYNEKLLIPDQCTNGVGTIVYSYEYPIKLFLEDEISRAAYGDFEDILQVDTEDKNLAKEIGLRHIEKHSRPILSGDIEPMAGIYYPGELLKIEIPSLNIDEYLVIKEVSYESVKGMGQINRRLTLESAARDLSAILKSMNQRLTKIENTLFGATEDTPVEKYKVMSDALVYPKLTDDGIAYILYGYFKLMPDLMCGIFSL
jgi:hypothetical protein